MTAADTASLSISITFRVNDMILLGLIAQSVGHGSVLMGHSIQHTEGNPRAYVSMREQCLVLVRKRTNRHRATGVLDAITTKAFPIHSLRFVVCQEIHAPQKHLYQQGATVFLPTRPQNAQTVSIAKAEAAVDTIVHFIVKNMIHRENFVMIIISRCRFWRILQ